MSGISNPGRRLHDFSPNLSFLAYRMTPVRVLYAQEKAFQNFVADPYLHVYIPGRTPRNSRAHELRDAHGCKVVNDENLRTTQLV